MGDMNAMRLVMNPLRSYIIDMAKEEGTRGQQIIMGMNATFDKFPSWAIDKALKELLEIYEGRDARLCAEIKSKLDLIRPKV